MKEQEQYQVQNLVILAAGMGSRMEQLTKDTPKPLVKVHGIPMIERLLDAGVRAKIPHMYIVTGYIGNQFSYLLQKYDNLALLYNGDYENANNISSVYVAREYLANAYIVEGDLVLYNPDLITTNQTESNYLGKKVEYTPDWCFDVKEPEQVIEQVKIGGRNCYHMYGISYWTPEDGVKLKDCLIDAYEKLQLSQLYWDEIPLSLYQNQFQVKVRPCVKEDIIEIDTFQELMDVDESYRK